MHRVWPALCSYFFLFRRLINNVTCFFINNQNSNNLKYQKGSKEKQTFQMKYLLSNEHYCCKIHTFFNKRIGYLPTPVRDFNKSSMQTGSMRVFCPPWGNSGLTSIRIFWDKMSQKIRQENFSKLTKISNYIKSLRIIFYVKICVEI